MTRHRPALGRGIAATMLVTFVAAACGAAATPTPVPTPTPTPTVAPTPTPTPEPTPSPSPTPLPDPSEGLAIAAPYTIEPIEPTIGAALDTAMRSALGSLSGAIEIGARTAAKDGATMSYVVVMRVPGVPVSSPAFLDEVAGGMAGTDGKVVKQTILDVPVRVVTAPTGDGVVFVIGDRIVMVVGAAQSVEISITTAIIKANS